MLLYLGRCAVATVAVCANFPSFWKIGGLVFVHVTRRCCFSLLLRSCGLKHWMVQRLRAQLEIERRDASASAGWSCMDHARPSSNVMHGACEDAHRACANTLLYFSCLKHVNEIVLGKSRQAHQRKQSFRFPSSLINHSTLLLERSSAKRAKLLVFTIMHSNTRQALNASTRQASCLTERVTIMHSNTRQALNASTRQASCLYWTRRSAKLLVFTIIHSNTRQALRVDAFGLREMVLGKSRQAHQRTITAGSPANNHALEHSTGSERVDAFGLREMVLGKSRQAHQRTQSLPSATHRHSSITRPTRPCCSSAQAPSFLSFTRRRVRDAPSR